MWKNRKYYCKMKFALVYKGEAARSVVLNLWGSDDLFTRVAYQILPLGS